jgi:hypothetical protein
LYISYSAVSIMVSVSHFKMQQCEFIVAIQCSAGNLVEYTLTNLAPRECVGYYANSCRQEPFSVEI